MNTKTDPFGTNCLPVNYILSNTLTLSHNFLKTMREQLLPMIEYPKCKNDTDINGMES